MEKKEVKKDWRKSLSKLDDEDVTFFLDDYQSFLKSEAVPSKAKKCMAALISIHETTKARQTGVLIMDINTVKRVAGLGLNVLRKNLEWLEKKGLVCFEVGVQRSAGVSGKGSRFTINFEALQNFNAEGVSEKRECNVIEYNVTKSNLTEDILSEDILIEKNQIENNEIYEKQIDETLIKNNEENSEDISLSISQENSFNNFFIDNKEENVTEDCLDNLFEEIPYNISFKNNKEENSHGTSVNLSFKKKEEDVTEDIAVGNITPVIISNKSNSNEEKTLLKKDVGEEQGIAEGNITPVIDEETLDNLRLKYREIEQLAMKKLDNHKFYQSEGGFKQLMDDTLYQLKSSLWKYPALLEKSKVTLGNKLRKEFKGYQPYPDIPSTVLIVEEPVGVATDLSRVSCL